MAQLGFTFYPRDWWTSDSFFILTPEERYIYLELLFIMYSNDGYVSDNQQLIEARLRTEITNYVWEKITELFVKEDGMLTHKSVNKRLRKTLANRENGKKGGRPKKDEKQDEEKPKKPKSETHEKTQKNPPLEREREREEEREYKKKEKGNIRALNFLKNNYPSRFETEFVMRYKSKIQNLKKFAEDFNDTCDQEDLEFTDKKLFARLGKYARNWVENQDRYKKAGPTPYESGKLERF